MQRGRSAGTQSSLKQLQAFLTHPREDLHVEIKSWLDLTDEKQKADLAQAMLALANSGGGYILLGFIQEGGNYVPQQSCPEDLKMYSHDSVNGIVQSYADPAFQCKVYHVNHPHTGEVFPIILVPGATAFPFDQNVLGLTISTYEKTLITSGDRALLVSLPELPKSGMISYVGVFLLNGKNF